MDRVREAIDRLAACDFTILITGESGTGKEVVARAIHARGRRRNGPFVAVSGAALVDSLLEAELFGVEERAATGVRARPGKLEIADGGTFFLDEVAELSGHAQAALLRVLQDLTVERVGGHRSRRIDARIMVATNQPLIEHVVQKRFRLDLFYRLSGVEVTVPPLRVRKEDIAALANHFVRIHGGPRPPLSQRVVAALTRYDWPGNVRELERIMQRAIAWSRDGEIDERALPSYLLTVEDGCSLVTSSSDESLRQVAADHVASILGRCHGNKALACRRLGISFHTLQRYLALRTNRRNPVEREVAA
jgi:transcriptional regulator with PAS, ATPase and Fis domain